MATNRIVIIIERDNIVEISKLKYEASILSPTNERTNASPTLRYLKYLMTPDWTEQWKSLLRQ